MQLWKLGALGTAWASGLVLALVLVIVTASTLSATVHFTVIKEEQASLRYPGLLVCPSYLSKGMAVVTGATYADEATVSVDFPALVDTLADSQDGYAVCPRTVKFEKDSAAVTCVDFQPEPELRKDAPAEASCDDDAQKAYFFVVDQPEIGMHDKVPAKPWHAASVESSIVFRSEISNATGLPLQVLLYDNDAEVPKTFEEYAKAFGLDGVRTVELALGTLQKIAVERVVRNRPSHNSDRFGAVDVYSTCDDTDFRVAYVSETALGSVSPNSVSAVLNPVSLAVKKECYAREFGFVEGTGVVGGVLAMTGSLIFLGVVAFKVYKRRADNGAWGALTDDERSTLLNSLVGGDDA